jgi:hypothetical protein
VIKISDPLIVDPLIVAPLIGPLARHRRDTARATVALLDLRYLFGIVPCPPHRCDTDARACCRP